MMNEQKRVLCLFDYGPTCMTGYATVSRNIVAQLKKHFGDNLQLDICATNYFGESYLEYNDTVKVTSARNEQAKMPAPEEVRDGDNFGLLYFLHLVKNGNYTSIFYIGDLGVIAPIVPLLEMYRQEKVLQSGILKDNKVIYPGTAFTSVIYFPVDGMLHPRVKNAKHDKSKIGVIPKEYRHLFQSGDVCQVDCLDFFDMPVTYTEYGKKEVLRLRPDFADRLFIVPHGTNTKDFFPMEKSEIKKFRDRYFGWNSSKFIVGVINRNQPRKDIPTAIFGFIEAKKNWDKHLPAPFLYLHMHPHDPKGWDLRRLLSLSGLEENKDYMFPKSDDANSQVDIETLNKIYNSIDVYLSTARGGGWELPITECMSVKTPCIIPEHTSMEEIGMDGHNAFMLYEFLPVCDTTDNNKRFMCHFDEVSDRILDVAADKYLYGGEREINPKVENAYQWITGMEWETVCQEWIAIFENL